MTRFDAIYARQSATKEESLSISTQIDFCMSKCDGTPRIYKDPGISGKDIVHRPDFNRLMRDIESGLIKKVVVYKLDRFTRSLMDFMNLWNFLSKYNVEFVSATENFDTTNPIGKAMLMISAVFAQLEREQISARITDNYYMRVQLGRWPGGPAPFGYKNVKAIDPNGKFFSSLEVTEDMAIVERILDEYIIPTVSLGTLRKQLNKEGIPSPSNSADNKRNLKGGKPSVPIDSSMTQSRHWNGNALSRVIRNVAPVRADFALYCYLRELGINIESDLETFTGEFGGLLVGKGDKRKRVPGKMSEATFCVGSWPGYIDSEKWIRCQRKMDQNEKFGNNGKGIHSWLSGLIKCANCSRALYIRAFQDEKSRRYLYCSGKTSDICDCNFDITIDEIEHEIQHQIDKLLSKCEPEQILEVHPDTEQLKIKLRKIELKIRNLVHIIANGASKLTIDYINEEMEILTKERDKIFEEINELERITYATPEPVDFEKLSFDEKKIYVNTYIERIWVYREHIRIKWNI